MNASKAAVALVLLLSTVTHGGWGRKPKPPPSPPPPEDPPPPPPEEPIMQAAVDITGGSSTPTADAEAGLNLFDASGAPISTLPHMAPLGARCEQAVRRAVAESGRSEAKLSVYPDPLQGVSVSARAHPDDVRLVFFILSSRPSAPLTVPRLIHALYDPSHLFLIHVDLKANQSIHDELSTHSANDRNVHVLKTRRLVQWGGFSMVSALLDSIASFLKRIDFDFVINLSDADLSLRTHDELSRFLRPFKGRVFMRIDSQPSSASSSSDSSDINVRHAFRGGTLRTNSVIECGGFGFVSVNSSHNDTSAQASIGPSCCVGQSGPLVHGTIPFAPPKPPLGSKGEYRGSQWSVLPRAFCEYLLDEKDALQWARVFERRLLADQFYLPTIVMHSKFRHSLVNTDLRYEQWPAGSEDERDAYWKANLPESEWGGAVPLNLTSMRAALRSPMVFAKKMTTTSLSGDMLPRYDAWMTRKLNGEFDPHQQSILAPLLRVDADLYGFGAPELSALPAAESTEAASVESVSMPPPRRVLRRRRVASLVFSDGSSCSCAPDCVPEARSLVEPSSSDADAGASGDDEEEPPEAVAKAQLHGCCAHLQDGRAALCDGPSIDPSISPSAMAASLLPAHVDDHDDGKASSSSRPCPIARFDLASNSTGGMPINVLFVNRAPYPVRLFHVDADAREVPALSLRMGEHAEVRSRSSQAWRARSHGGALLMELAGAVAASEEEESGVATVYVLPCGQ